MENVTEITTKKKTKLTATPDVMTEADLTSEKLAKTETIFWIGKKVKRISMHQATNINGNVKGTLDYLVNAADMTLLPVGVLCKIKDMKGREVTRLITLNNIYEMDLFE